MKIVNNLTTCTVKYACAHDIMFFSRIASVLGDIYQVETGEKVVCSSED